METLFTPSNKTGNKLKNNPCSSSPCYPFVACEAVDEESFKCGKCPLGMEGDGITCEDIDEVSYGMLFLIELEDFTTCCNFSIIRIWL